MAAQAPTGVRRATFGPKEELDPADDEDVQEVQIWWGLTGVKFTTTLCKPSTTILQAKQDVLAKTGIPIEQQRLFGFDCSEFLTDEVLVCSVKELAGCGGLQIIVNGAEDIPKSAWREDSSSEGTLEEDCLEASLSSEEGLDEAASMVPPQPRPGPPPGRKPPPPPPPPKKSSVVHRRPPPPPPPKGRSPPNRSRSPSSAAIGQNNDNAIVRQKRVAAPLLSPLKKSRRIQPVTIQAPVVLRDVNVFQKKHQVGQGTYGYVII